MTLTPVPGQTPRHKMKRHTGIPEQMRFLEYLGDYDLYWDSRAEAYTVVCCPASTTRGYNFTDYSIDENDGTLSPHDTDVVLDPYHMCLLYQAHDRWDLLTGATATAEDDNP